MPTQAPYNWHVVAKRGIREGERAVQRYYIRVHDTDDAPLDMEAVKKAIRKVVCIPRWRTMDEGENSAEKVLTFTPEAHEVERAHRAVATHFPGRMILLRLERD